MKARENPFRTERVHAVRFRLAGTTWGELVGRLASLGHRAAIVGPDGSGKTTLLERLEPRLADAGLTAHWLHVSNERRRLPKGTLARLLARLGDRDVILFDGADLMGTLAWRRLRRRSTHGAGLIVTSHRPGLLPTLLECRTTPELLADIVAELVPGQIAELRPRIPALFEKHGGDLRLALRELYDLYAER